MENELDLTLRLGLPNPTVQTQLSLNTLTSDQGTNVNVVHGGSGDDEVIIDNNEGARNNVNVNIRVYSYVFQRFAGSPNTLNFTPYPMHPSPPPAPVMMTPPTSDYVLLDVPSKRAQSNNSLAMTNANERWRGGCSSNSGGSIEGTRKCTNINCNTVTTPMWRRGPLGPKSLCNACGIKFRKEEEKRSKRNL